jgi:hypothetical protein
MFPKMMNDALELAGLVRPVWQQLSDEIARSGAPTCKVAERGVRDKLKAIEGDLSEARDERAAKVTARDEVKGKIAEADEITPELREEAETAVRELGEVDDRIAQLEADQVTAWPPTSPAPRTCGAATTRGSCRSCAATCGARPAADRHDGLEHVPVHRGVGGVHRRRGDRRGCAKPEAGITFTDAEATARTIAAWLKLQKQSLEDVPALRAVIESRLRYLVERRLEAQVLAGNGTAPNLRGILNTSGIGAVAYDAGELPADQILTGITTVLLADAIGDGIVMQPARLAGHPEGQGDRRRPLLLRWPVQRHPAGHLGRAADPVPCDHAGHGARRRLGDRRAAADPQGVQVLLSDSDQDDFTKNKVTLLGEMRAALPVCSPRVHRRTSRWEDNERVDEDEFLTSALEGAVGYVGRRTVRQLTPVPPEDEDPPITLTTASSPAVRVKARRFLRVPDAREVTALTINGVAITEYELRRQPQPDSPAPVIDVLDAALLVDRPAIEITGRFGFSPVPPELVDGVLALAAQRYQERNGNWGTQQRSDEFGMSGPYGQLDLATRATLAGYQVPLDSYVSLA